MGIELEYYSFKYAKEILESINPELLKEVETILYNSTSTLSDLSRPVLTDRFESYMLSSGWDNSLGSKHGVNVDYFKNNVGVKLRIGHPKFIGSDLLEFELASQSNKSLSNIAIYIVVTSSFRKSMIDNYHIKWEASLTFEKAKQELIRYNQLISTPILLIGIDLH